MLLSVRNDNNHHNELLPEQPARGLHPDWRMVDTTVTTVIRAGEPVDLMIPLPGLEWDGGNASNFQLASNVVISRGEEKVASLPNGKGFSFVRQSDVGHVLLAISMSDTSFLEPGTYEWTLPVRALDGFTVLREVGGTIEVLDEPAQAEPVNVKPWDLLSDSAPRASKEVRDQRMATCRGCDRYLLGVCRECGCVMGLKTTLAQARCPLGKWEAVP